MKLVFQIAIYSCLFLFIESCHKEEIILNSEPNKYFELPKLLVINQKNCSYDYKSNTLRYPIDQDSIENFSPLISFQEFSKVFFNGKELVNNKINSLGKIYVNKEYEVKIVAAKTTNNIKLKFTKLPIVQIVTSNNIYDEPKTLARFTINYPSLKTLNSYIGIETKGSYANLQFPKKSFRFSFINNTNIDDLIPQSLFDLKRNTDWILDGMYDDHTKSRNKLGNQIWTKITGNKHFGGHLNYVELYINNEHKGIYCLSESVNDQLIGIQNNDDLLYTAINWQGEPIFTEIVEKSSNIDTWDGWKQDYPKPSFKLNWEPLSQLRKVIIDGSDQEFINQIPNLIDLDLLVDYYLFIDLIGGYDNLGKNISLYKPANTTKLQVIPFDYDNAFINTGLVTLAQRNKLHDRLIELNPENFNTKLKERWIQLRNETFSLSNLYLLSNENLDLLIQSDIIDIENNIWNSNINIKSEHNKLKISLDKRISIMDKQYQ